MGAAACQHTVAAASIAPALQQRLHSTSAGALPADTLPLPERRLTDDVADALRGEAEELPLSDGEEAAAALAGQHCVTTDAVAGLPMGQALRQEASFQGRSWAFETGKLARLANGSCLVQAGGTTVLAAATSQSPPWSRRDSSTLQLDVSCVLGWSRATALLMSLAWRRWCEQAL